MLHTKQSITPLEWMSRPETESVMRALNINDSVINALFVGGCVRDAILGKDVFDIDIACRLSPDRSSKLLRDAGIKVIPTGLEHGTITAVLNHKPFEITTLRRDIKTYGRKADVEFTEDWLDDAKRRDFTINTLLLDIHGNIYDPLDVGVEDLKSGKIRFVGDPEKRIQEDYLRILRYFRFYATHGRDDLRAEELKLCQRYADKILILSKERITSEFLKILSSNKAAHVLSLMHEYDVLSDYIDCDGFEILTNIIALQDRYQSFNIVSRLFLIMTQRTADNSFLQLSNKDKKFIAHLGLALEQLSNSELSIKTIKEISYQFSLELAFQSGLVFLSMNNLESYPSAIEDFFQDALVPVFPLKGKDLIELGVSKGPQMGELLNIVEKWWIDQGFEPDKKECLRYLEEQLNQ
jgi:poly(A) polymerase